MRKLTNFITYSITRILWSARVNKFNVGYKLAEELASRSIAIKPLNYPKWKRAGMLQFIEDYQVKLEKNQAHKDLFDQGYAYMTKQLSTDDIVNMKLLTGPFGQGMEKARKDSIWGTTDVSKM